MKSKSLLVLITLFILGCGITNTEEEKLYEWEHLSFFKNSFIDAIATNGPNNLFIAKDGKLYKSGDKGKSIKRIFTPDSANIEKIKVYDRIYIIGNVYRPTGGFFGSTVSWVYSSTDEGQTWDAIIGGFIMQDLVVSENRLHIGRKHGVTTFDLQTGETFRNSFIYSKLSDHIEEITSSPQGDIYLASHDGIHASFNKGETWEKISSRIKKDNDWFRNLAVDENNMLYGAESDRLYYLEVGTDDWKGINTRLGTQMVRLLSDNEIIIGNSDEVRIANRNNLEFEKIFEIEYNPDVLSSMEFMEVFEDDAIVVAGSGGIYIGTKNEN